MLFLATPTLSFANDTSVIIKRYVQLAQIQKGYNEANNISSEARKVQTPPPIRIKSRMSTIMPSASSSMGFLAIERCSLNEDACFRVLPKTGGSPAKPAERNRR